uniref:Mutator-like transposase domain-containing protein n=1 Tax=Trichogramma kaykai TaxID=54128 RepID=A0ABD2X6V9_9HYME
MLLLDSTQEKFYLILSSPKTVGYARLVIFQKITIAEKIIQAIAKSMEPSMAVELYTKNDLLDMNNVVLNVLIGDDDCSTIAAVRRESSVPVKKLADFNHSKRNFTSSLYALKVSKTIIEYFSYKFSLAVKLHKGDEAAIKKSLEEIIPLAFGDHSICEDPCQGKILGD